MCISEVSCISHTNDAEDDAKYSQHRKSDQETQSPFPILDFINWITSQDGEAPDYSEDEV